MVKINIWQYHVRFSHKRIHSYAGQMKGCVDVDMGGVGSDWYPRHGRKDREKVSGGFNFLLAMIKEDKESRFGDKVGHYSHGKDNGEVVLVAG